MFEELKEMIALHLNVEAADIQESTRVIEDLGADSANLMMLVMDLEAEFNMTVEDDAISSIRTVGDIVDYIAKHA